ncbi:MAG: carboxypeptidase regulatory-like domain-containing protein [bacterium]|nr:carboxypeptidase regulatory-like domain-containing protein [bacterium]
MKKFFSILLSLSLLACAQMSGSVTQWDDPLPTGPVIVGVVTHPDGHALAGIPVTSHSGLATRFPSDSTHTDAEGRFRIEKINCTQQRDEDGIWRAFVGICVGSVRSDLNPPEFLPWKDVHVEMSPGNVVHVDFVFDPMAIAPEHRAE